VRRVRSLLSEQMEQRANINKEMSLIKDQLAAARAKEAEEEQSKSGGGGGNALKDKLAALQNQWKARQGIKTLTAKEQRVDLELRLQTLEGNVASCSSVCKSDRWPAKGPKITLNERVQGDLGLLTQEDDGGQRAGYHA